MGSPLIIGHRGASVHAPENTLAAFRLAIEANADGVEFDVRLTKDGVPVVIHDDNLRRTGGVNRRVSDLSIAELKAIDVGSWKDPQQFAKEPVPTLFELFELFEGSPSVLYLEMKSEPEQRELLAQVCCDALKQTPLRDQVVVECFDLTGIELVKTINPEIKTAALFEPSIRHTPLAGSTKRMIDKAISVGADEIAFNHRLVNAQAVEMARSSKLNVVVWTVDDPGWMNSACAEGLKALITNDPQKMIQGRAH